MSEKQEPGRCSWCDMVGVQRLDPCEPATPQPPAPSSGEEIVKACAKDIAARHALNLPHDFPQEEAARRIEGWLKPYFDAALTQERERADRAEARLQEQETKWATVAGTNAAEAKTLRHERDQAIANRDAATLIARSLQERLSLHEDHDEDCPCSGDGELHVYSCRDCTCGIGEEFREQVAEVARLTEENARLREAAGTLGGEAKEER